MKDHKIYLSHIHQCILKIKDYTKGMTEHDFLSNQLVQDAVIRNFEIIGEASKKIPQDFKLLSPSIEWKKMAGMRDKLIHDYIGVDIWAVWAVVEDILPDFENEIMILLQDS